MAIKGLPMSASVTPVAFNKARWGDLSNPSFIWLERMLVIIILQAIEINGAAHLVERLLSVVWFFLVLVYLFLTHSLDSSTVLRFVRRTARIIITITMDRLMVLNILSPKKRKPPFRGRLRFISFLLTGDPTFWSHPSPAQARVGSPGEPQEE